VVAGTSDRPGKSLPLSPFDAWCAMSCSFSVHQVAHSFTNQYVLQSLEVLSRTAQHKQGLQRRTLHCRRDLGEDVNLCSWCGLESLLSRGRHRNELSACQCNFTCARTYPLIGPNCACQALLHRGSSL